MTKKRRKYKKKQVILFYYRKDLVCMEVYVREAYPSRDEPVFKNVPPAAIQGHEAFTMVMCDDENDFIVGASKERFAPESLIEYAQGWTVALCKRREPDAWEISQNGNSFRLVPEWSEA